MIYCLLSFLLNTLLMWLSKSLWHVRIATNPPDSPVLHLTHLFSIWLTWLICFPPVFTQFTCSSPCFHPISPAFIRYHPFSPYPPVLQMIHLFSSWFTCFSPYLPIFARFHPFSPNSHVLHPVKRSNSLWHYACDNTREGIYQRELPARPPPSKEGPQNPPDKCPAKIKGDLGVILGDHLATKDNLPLLGHFL